MWFLLLPINYLELHLKFFNICRFSIFSPLLISNLIPLCSENIFYMIVNLLNLLRLALLSNMWSVLESVPCTFGNYFCSCWLECAVDVSSVKVVDRIVQIFYIHVDFLCGCSTCNYSEWGIEASIIILEFFIYPFSFVTFASNILAFSVRSVYSYYISLMNWLNKKVILCL